MRTRQPPDYLSKFGIAITQKEHDELNPRTGQMIYHKSEPCHDFITKYGYFDVDKGGNITFIITLVSIRNKMSYTIKIAQQHIYNSLLLKIPYHPVIMKPWRNKNFYVHKNIEGLVNLDELYGKLTPPEIRERFMAVKDKMSDIITSTPNEERKRTAELQMNRLIGQQWKMEPRYEMYLAEKF